MPLKSRIQQPSATITPLLIDRAIERTGDDHIPGGYCTNRHVWLVDGHPIVETKSPLAELTTKTEAQIERDDTGDPSYLEMQTKTLSQSERDDQDFVTSLLELSTKTRSISERDD